MKRLGIFIIIVGLGLTIFTALTFFTREKVADIGTVKIIRDKPHHLRLVATDWYCCNGGRRSRFVFLS